MSIAPEDIDAVMETHDFFGGLDADARTALMERGEVREREGSTVLFHGGEAYRGFYLLIEGAVHVYRLSGEGRMLVLHVLRAGESFAEVPLFEDQTDPTYPATAETLDDSTLLFFPAEAFLDFIDDHPRLALQMLGQMAKRLREAVRQLDAVSLQDVQERLARHLIEQVPAVPDDPEEPPPSPSTFPSRYSRPSWGRCRRRCRAPFGRWKTRSSSEASRRRSR